MMFKGAFFTIIKYFRGYPQKNDIWLQFRIYSSFGKYSSLAHSLKYFAESIQVLQNMTHRVKWSHHTPWICHNVLIMIASQKSYLARR